MSFVHVTFQTNGVWMWLDREEENLVVFLLFSFYTRKLQEWFALLFALLVVLILAHTCWVGTFSCLSQERTVHYTIVLIPTVFLILEEFEFTLHSYLWSFTKIIILCRLGSVHVIFLSYYYRERTKLKWKVYIIRPFPKNNWHEFQYVYIRPRSAVDSAQWDLGIMMLIFGLVCMIWFHKPQICHKLSLSAIKTIKSI